MVPELNVPAILVNSLGAWPFFLPRPTDSARFLGPLVEKERRRIDLRNKRLDVLLARRSLTAHSDMWNDDRACAVFWRLLPQSETCPFVAFALVWDVRPSAVCLFIAEKSKVFQVCSMIGLCFV